MRELQRTAAGTFSHARSAHIASELRPHPREREARRERNESTVTLWRAPRRPSLKQMLWVERDECELFPWAELAALCAQAHDVIGG